MVQGIATRVSFAGSLMILLTPAPLAATAQDKLIAIADITDWSFAKKANEQLKR